MFSRYTICERLLDCQFLDSVIAPSYVEYKYDDSSYAVPVSGYCFAPLCYHQVKLVLSTILRHISLTPILYFFVKSMLPIPYCFSGLASSICRKRVVGL